MQFAITYAAGVFDTRGKIMGRQAAGQGFLRGVLASRPARLWAYALNRDSAQSFGRDILALTDRPPELRFIPWAEPERLAEAGLLYRADPSIVDDAWHRRHRGHSRSWSLCGVTHTLCSQEAMTVATELLHAPVCPWDALVCTSTVARDVLRSLLESEMEHLASRFGAARFTLPQLPLIPLGVHTADYSISPEARAAARANLGLGNDDVAALFVGRLVFHAKAHPLPMFLGLQAAAESTHRPVHLILFGVAPNVHIEAAFRAEAARFAPKVTLHLLDGTSDENRDTAWGAADLFTSLSDNIQETFGLTPIEAMAAGLPVVVSDWNGYKDTVRHGVDGFRVPTLAPPPGAGAHLMDRYDARVDTFDTYIGAASQFVAVDVAAAADAYTRLVESPELRARFGEAGRRRARETFEWSLVFRRYAALFEELAERRRADPRCPGEEATARRPDRPDPFTLFRTYPTATLKGTHRVRLRPGAADDIDSFRALASIGYAAALHPAPADTTAIVEALSLRDLTVADLHAECPTVSSQALARAVLWLAKLAVVEIVPSSVPERTAESP